MHIQMLSK